MKTLNSLMVQKKLALLYVNYVVRKNHLHLQNRSPKLSKLHIPKTQFLNSTSGIPIKILTFVKLCRKKRQVVGRFNQILQAASEFTTSFQPHYTRPNGISKLKFN